MHGVNACTLTSSPCSCMRCLCPPSPPPFAPPARCWPWPGEPTSKSSSRRGRGASRWESMSCWAKDSASGGGRSHLRAVCAGMCVHSTLAPLSGDVCCILASKSMLLSHEKYSFKVRSQVHPEDGGKDDMAPCASCVPCIMLFAHIHTQIHTHTHIHTDEGHMGLHALWARAISGKLVHPLLDAMGAQQGLPGMRAAHSILEGKPTREHPSGLD
eukprot:1160224-Pelagomonas_calceolata.AAC.10